MRSCTGRARALSCPAAGRDVKDAEPCLGYAIPDGHAQPPCRKSLVPCALGLSAGRTKRGIGARRMIDRLDKRFCERGMLFRELTGGADVNDGIHREHTAPMLRR